MTAAEPPFSDDELERYARHIVLREIGGTGQQRLRKSRVLVIGAGGLGSPVLMYLAASGVGTLGIVDDDDVSLSNLQRQILHTTADIGTPKTQSGHRHLAGLNPHIHIEIHPVRLADANADTLIGGYDLVIDGSDTYQTRWLVNLACTKASVPLISGAISQWEGQLSLFDPANGAPCYACIFPHEPAVGLAPSCAEAGVLAPLPGVVGSLMATEAIKHITGAGRTLMGELLIVDALHGENRRLVLARDPSCPVCSV